jgi:uncharacterized membrane protein YedE/YeeE
MNFSSNIKFLFVGIYFGIIFVKAEIISWFRIQEMFRFQSFHMYGVIGTAIAVGMISIFIIKKFNIKTISGEKIEIEPKPYTKGNIYGSLLFGCGWALTGACPGPLYALMGAGFWVISIAFLMALVGTWTYGYFKEKLPH